MGESRSAWSLEIVPEILQGQLARRVFQQQDDVGDGFGAREGEGARRCGAR